MESHSSPSKLSDYPESESELEDLSSCGSWRYEVRSGDYHYSKGASRILGIDPDNTETAPTLADCLTPEFRKKWSAALGRIEVAETPLRFVGRISANDAVVEIAWKRRGEFVLGSISDISRHIQHREETQQTHDLLLEAIDTLPIRIFWKDLESRYLGCNAPFAADAGLATPSAVRGKTDFELFTKADAEFFRTIDKQVMESGNSQEQFIEPQVRPDGSSAWLRTSKVPLKNQEGAVFGVLGTYEDITEEKEREQRFALTHYSIDAVQSAIFWCNSDGTFFFVNRTACEWLQYSREELLNMSVSDINPNFPKEAWPAHWEEIKNAGVLEMKTEHKRKDGTWYPVEMHSNYVNIDGHEFKIAFVFDISEKLENEAKILEYQHNLEKLVEIRTEELRETNKELEAFAYSVSHDLRAPLRGIDGFGQALIEDYESSLDDQGKHYLNRIRNGTQKMSSLIDDILQLSRISRMEMSRQLVDLTSMLTSICNELHEAHPDHAVEAIIEPGVSIHCDPDLMQIAFQNLLENAWKYTSKTESAKVIISTRFYDDARVICVEDNGAGFDMAYAGKLFAPFQRLHRQDEYEGNGIGLATVQRIANKHAGSVWAESKPESGSRFYLRIPIVDPPEPPFPK